jgi:hypothetical protein
MLDGGGPARQQLLGAQLQCNSRCKLRHLRTAAKAATRAETLAIACTSNSACCVGALGASADVRFLLTRAERSNNSGVAPLKVLGGGGGAFAQLVQRTNNPRTPPPSTTRPPATRQATCALAPRTAGAQPRARSCYWTSPLPMQSARPPTYVEQCAARAGAAAALAALYVYSI